MKGVMSAYEVSKAIGRGLSSRVATKLEAASKPNGRLVAFNAGD